MTDSATDISDSSADKKPYDAWLADHIEHGCRVEQRGDATVVSHSQACCERNRREHARALAAMREADPSVQPCAYCECERHDRCLDRQGNGRCCCVLLRDTTTNLTKPNKSGTRSLLVTRSGAKPRARL